MFKFRDNPQTKPTHHAIIAVYVDDSNLVGTLEKLTKTANYLKNEFKLKHINFFFFLLFILAYKLNTFQMKFLFITQTTQGKSLNTFHMDKAYSLSIPIVFW
jgi:hypothetical protein